MAPCSSENLPGERLVPITEIEKAIDSPVFKGSQVAGHMNIVRGQPSQVFRIGDHGKIMADGDQPAGAVIDPSFDAARRRSVCFSPNR
jgi:hypothetical protein